MVPVPAESNFIHPSSFRASNACRKPSSLRSWALGFTFRRRTRGSLSLTTSSLKSRKSEQCVLEMRSCHTVMCNDVVVGAVQKGLAVFGWWVGGWKYGQVYKLVRAKYECGVQHDNFVWERLTLFGKRALGGTREQKSDPYSACHDGELFHSFSGSVFFLKIFFQVSCPVLPPFFLPWLWVASRDVHLNQNTFYASNERAEESCPFHQRPSNVDNCLIALVGLEEILLHPSFIQ